MKKREIIKKKEDFNFIIKTGKKINNNIYSLYYVDNVDNINKFGLAISKKIANAVYRNKAKRQLREIIGKAKLLFPKSKNYIIIVKERFFLLNFNEKFKNLIELIEKVK